MLRRGEIEPCLVLVLYIYIIYWPSCNTWSSIQPPQLPACEIAMAGTLEPSETWRLRWRLAGHHDDVVDLAWAQNSQFFASCSKARARGDGGSEKTGEFEIVRIPSFSQNELYNDV